MQTDRCNRPGHHVVQGRRAQDVHHVAQGSWNLVVFVSDCCGRPRGVLGTKNLSGRLLFFVVTVEALLSTKRDVRCGDEPPTYIELTEIQGAPTMSMPDQLSLEMQQQELYIYPALPRSESSDKS